MLSQSLALTISILAYLVSKVLTAFTNGDRNLQRYPKITASGAKRLESMVLWVNTLNVLVPFTVYRYLGPDTYANYTIGTVFNTLAIFIGYVLGRIVWEESVRIFYPIPKSKAMP